MNFSDDLVARAKSVSIEDEFARRGVRLTGRAERTGRARNAAERTDFRSTRKNKFGTAADAKSAAISSGSLNTSTASNSNRPLNALLAGRKWPLRGQVPGLNPPHRRGLTMAPARPASGKKAAIRAGRLPKDICSAEVSNRQKIARGSCGSAKAACSGKSASPRS
jgi:hypothetical protein